MISIARLGGLDARYGITDGAHTSASCRKRRVGLCCGVRRVCGRPFRRWCSQENSGMGSSFRGLGGIASGGHDERGARFSLLPLIFSAESGGESRHGFPRNVPSAGYTARTLQAAELSFAVEAPRAKSCGSPEGKDPI